LERRHRALAGRRVPRHRTPVPLARLADDVARLRRVLARQNGPTLLAGHSYGGQSKAKVMFAVQQPLHWSSLEEVMGVPAWKSLPSWFLVADGDQAIPPDAHRQFAARMGATTVELSTNHVAMVSHPDEVLQLIRTAAEAASR
jgi:pimeloyl-ACP methyl ester carboxylesterase